MVRKWNPTTAELGMPARPRSSGNMPRRSADNRRGVALMVALVCLAIVAIFLGAIVKVTFSWRQQSRVLERQLQADWLAEAGAERAAAALSRSPDYPGETWQIAATEFAGRGRGTVLIRVEKKLEQRDVRVVRVQADFPAESDSRTRSSKHVIVNLAQAKSGDNS